MYLHQCIEEYAKHIFMHVVSNETFLQHFLVILKRMLYMLILRRHFVNFDRTAWRRTLLLQRKALCKICIAILIWKCVSGHCGNFYHKWQKMLQILRSICRRIKKLEQTFWRNHQVNGKSLKSVLTLSRRVTHHYMCVWLKISSIGYYVHANYISMHVIPSASSAWDFFSRKHWNELIPECCLFLNYN